MIAVNGIILGAYSIILSAEFTKLFAVPFFIVIFASIFMLVFNVYELRVQLEVEIGTRKAKGKKKPKKNQEQQNAHVQKKKSIFSFIKPKLEFFEKLFESFEKFMDKIFWRDSVPLFLIILSIIFLFLTIFYDC